MFFTSKQLSLLIAIALLPVLTLANSISLLSAVEKDTPIAGASVFFQKNGHETTTVQSSTTGLVNADFIDNSDTLLIIKKPGYSTLVAKCPCDGFTYALSPVMENIDGLRIVLTWGETPYDLDSHIVYPNNHVFFDHQVGQASNLDVDDTDSYGPETITLTRKLEGQKYVYSVYDFTNGGANRGNALNLSRARVEVYVGETMIRNYAVDPTKEGDVWVVFGIDESGAFQDINQYAHLAHHSHIELLDAIIAADSFESYSIIDPEAIKQAKQSNTRGEAAYHEGDLENAMYLFQDAVSLNPSYGQAYSNLGLTFQKLDRNAEALWANQKAIDLASGSRANTVKASSYYNIARIYESEQRWQDALNNFNQALSLREHSAYHNGIARMQEKLN